MSDTNTPTTSTRLDTAKDTLVLLGCYWQGSEIFLPEDTRKKKRASTYIELFFGDDIEKRFSWNGSEMELSSYVLP